MDAREGRRKEAVLGERVDDARAREQIPAEVQPAAAAVTASAMTTVAPVPNRRVRRERGRLRRPPAISAGGIAFRKTALTAT